MKQQGQHYHNYSNTQHFIPDKPSLRKQHRSQNAVSEVQQSSHPADSHHRTRVTLTSVAVCLLPPAKI